ncbi:flagellar filament capping protein FliD [Altererythrobacter sp. KTW20L]|uniref:flagellar filament capping protein FliD n=1 Tax=Altererythrobacter sp. KTW20L TaxID=2942210 RepID=UPI00209AB52D|nr:flagellar filament capping protein FliD [Altererythrobacter sp. KTW20L]MCL6252188.1 flagellar filament capping protein FliD [Altererythrobacter sp. KTW20L]
METSTTSTIISALGGGSGVDMVKLASDLSRARFLPQVGQIESRSQALEARISAASTLRNQLTSLASALGDRIRNGDLSPTATIGNGAVAQVSVLTGASGKGTYSLEVTALAGSQTLAGNSYSAATDLVGEGQLTIRFGAIDGTSFNEDPAHAAAVIDVSDTDTLASLATKISASGSGLTAYVAQSATGARLVVKGQDGAANAFVIEASGASVSGSPAPGALDYLDWNPAIDSGQRKASAADAAFLLDGVEMTSASNKASGLPGGLVLTLTGTNAGAPTQIGFADKSKQITAMMGDFTAALNDITASLAELAAPQGGELGNDPGARALKRALATLSTQVIMPNAAEGEPRTLGDLGLVLTREGNFRLDSTRLQETLSNNLSAAGAMFTTGLFGVFGTVDSMARNLSLRTNPGSLGGSIERYTDQLEKLDERLAKIAEQQERVREQLVKTFAATDRNVAASQSTMAFLKNQIAAWNTDNR